MKQNTFDSIFYKIEKEYLELTESIMFNDEHRKVYSIKITDLIVRIVMEIENTARELYRSNQENSVGYVRFNEYIEFLETKYKLSKKNLYIFNSNCNFIKNDLIRDGFLPFINCINTDINNLGWYYVYNKLKHDRDSNIQYANIWILTESLGALYILKSLTKLENKFFPNSSGNLFEISESKIFKSSIFVPDISYLYVDSNYLYLVLQNRKYIFKNLIDFWQNPSFKVNLPDSPVFVLSKDQNIPILLEEIYKKILNYSENSLFLSFMSPHYEFTYQKFSLKKYIKHFLSLDSEEKVELLKLPIADGIVTLVDLESEILPPKIFFKDDFGNE